MWAVTVCVLPWVTGTPIGSIGLVAASDPSDIWNEDVCITGKERDIGWYSTQASAGPSELKKICRANGLPLLSVPNAAFPTCGQHTKANLRGQYLLPVCLVHHSFVRRWGVQRTEHLHAFDSRSVYMRQGDHVGTNHPRKSMLASGSTFYRQASRPGGSRMLAFASRCLSLGKWQRIVCDTIVPLSPLGKKQTLIPETESRWAVARGWGEGPSGEWPVDGYRTPWRWKKCFRTRWRWWLHVNILDATELCISKWLMSPQLKKKQN